MSESLSSPWISDYLVDIAEKYGAQIFNAPISKKKRRVQLTDFLTYQEDSYVWAWVSDKEYRISVRISKDAVDRYKSNHSCNITSSRFFPVFIGDFRPMFAPRPLGANTVGNTSIPHLSLEVGLVTRIGAGSHLFGNPRDLESDEKLREWIVGLRQDGGGGNVLKLRKQEEAAQPKNPPAPPKIPTPLAPQAPVPPKPAPKATDIANTKPPRPQDFRRAYDKRWRRIEMDPWKFALKPTVKEPSKQVEIAPPPIKPPTDSTSEVTFRLSTRTPSPKPISRPGTPTDWSVSNRGSPVPQDEADTHDPENGKQQEEDADVLPPTAQLPSDTEGHVAVESVGVVTSQETSSVQPPTPAQRIKRSPPPQSSSPSRSSPGRSVQSPSCHLQHLPHSSPPLLSSSLPPPSSSLPTQVGIIRKNIQRKVPRPEVPRSDSNKDGPTQILVPNSDTSGTASSQSQYLSQSQQSQPRSQPHAPAFPSSLAKEFKPPHASTPKVQTPRRTSKMFAENSSVLSDIEEQGTTLADELYGAEEDGVNTRKQNGSRSNRLPAPSAPQIEVLQVDRSEVTEEEIDELQLTHNTRNEPEGDTWTRTQDKGEGSADADREDNQLSDDDAEVNSRLQHIPRQASSPPAFSTNPRLSPDKPSTNGASIQHYPRPSEKPVSQSSMHSLFSDTLGDEQTPPSQAPVVAVPRTEYEAQAQARSSPVPAHDPDAWKEPSFISKNKGKGKARALDEEPGTPVMQADRKRRRSAHADSESPLAKRPKVVAAEEPRPLDSRERKTSGGVRRLLSQTTAWLLGRAQPHNSEEARPNERLSTAPTDITETTSQPFASQQSKPRLVNFLVDFEKMDLGEGMPMASLDWNTDILNGLLRTGRIRTLGDEVLQDGSVFIDQE